MRGRRIKTLYMRILLTYLPLVAAILMGTTAAIILVTGNYFSVEMNKMRQATLYMAADALDEKINNLYDVLFQLAMNNSVLDYERISDGDLDYKDIMTIQSASKAIGNAVINSSLIREAFLYRSDIDSVFSSQYRGPGLYNPSDDSWTFFSDYFERMDRDEVCAVFRSVVRRSFLLLSDGDDTVLLLATPVPIASDESPMMLALIVNVNELRRLSALSLGEGEELFVTDETGRIIFSMNGSYAGMTLSEAGFAKESPQGGKHELYTKESIHIHLNYCYVTDPTFLQQYSNTVTLYCIIIGSVALGIISLSILLLSRRIYQPIRSILSMLPRNARDETDSDTDRIRESISGLCLESARLRRNIQSARPYVLERILFKMLHDDIPPEKAKLIMEEMSITFEREYAAVCILSISGYAAMTRELPESIITGMKERVSADIAEAFADLADTYVISEENLIYAIVNFNTHPEIAEERLAACLISVQRQALEMYQIRMRVVIGTIPAVSVAHDTQSLMDGLQESLVSAEEAMDFLFFAGDEQALCRASQHKHSPVNAYFFAPDQEQEISSLLFMGRKEEAIREARDLIDENIRANQNHYANTQQLLNDLLSVAIRTVLNSNTPLDRVLKPRQALHAGFVECESLRQATEYIYWVYRTVADYFVAADARWPVKREDVLTYIRENLDQCTSVTDIALHFNLSRGYYCKIFREMTGITTLEYISRCRIEQAQELIGEGRLSLKAIADKVGIGNYRTFIRLFKKYTLCTPGQYKQKNTLIPFDETPYN